MSLASCTPRLRFSYALKLSVCTISATMNIQKGAENGQRERSTNNTVASWSNRPSSFTYPAFEQCEPLRHTKTAQYASAPKRFVLTSCLHNTKFKIWSDWTIAGFAKINRLVIACVNFYHPSEKEIAQKWVCQTSRTLFDSVAMSFGIQLVYQLELHRNKYLFIEIVFFSMCRWLCCHL
jgi:hypothetical protein